MADETVVDKKAKKARKPYVWTPQRKEAFDRMKKKRDEKLQLKKVSIEQGKSEVAKDKKHLVELLKSTTKLKQILRLIESEGYSVEPETPHPIEKKEIVAAVKKEQPKPKIKPRPPTPPQSDSESEEEMEEEEELEPTPPLPTPKPPVNTFRYTTKTSHVGLPKAPIPKSIPTPTPTPTVKKVSPYLFL